MSSGDEDVKWRGLKEWWGSWRSLCDLLGFLFMVMELRWRRRIRFES